MELQQQIQQELSISPATIANTLENKALEVVWGDRLLLETAAVQTTVLTAKSTSAQGQLQRTYTTLPPALIEMVPLTVLPHALGAFLAAVLKLPSRKLVQISGDMAQSLAHNSPNDLHRALESMMPNELASKGGQWAVAATRAEAGDVVHDAAVEMGSGGMATQGGQWAVAATRTGAGDVVRDAAVEMGSGGMATQGGRWAVAATRAGAGGVVRDAAVEMGSGGMATQGGQWATAATRAGAGDVVHGAAVEMGSGGMATQGGQWAVAATRAGAGHV
jgi:hypothetical protein